jgi:hypothetical protein
MGKTAGGKTRRKRKSRVSAAEHLVMGELSRRGFDVELSTREQHFVLVRAGGSSPKAVQVKTMRSTPWYVRFASFAKRADQVTVYVLLPADRMSPARFFVAKNGDVVSQVRQPPAWNDFGLIDEQSVEKYEDNWDILR